MTGTVLHHYTSELHLPHILAAGHLRTTESNVSITREHAGPDVVWALDTDWMPGNDLPHGLWAIKTRVRFAFPATKRAVRWRDWEWTAKMDPVWRDTMIRTGGGGEAADHWWVVTRPVLAKQWLAVERLDPGLGWVPAAGTG